MTTFAAHVYCRGCGELLQYLQAIEPQWVRQVGATISKTARMCKNHCLEHDAKANIAATIVWQKEPVVHAERTEIVQLLSQDCIDLSPRQSRLRDVVLQLLGDNKP